MSCLIIGDCRIDGAFGPAVGALADWAPSALLVINLESAITPTGRLHSTKARSLCAALSDLDAVCHALGKRLVVNVANNHSADAGGDALNAAVGRLRDRGVPCVLPGRSVRIQDAQGTVFRFVGFWCGAPGPGRQAADMPWADIATARHQGERVIALPHWGEEYVFFPSPAQRRLARALVAAGVDLIVGSHPHVVQGLETMGTAQVFYSTGNGVFDTTPPGSRLGYAVHADATPDGLTARRWWYRIAPTGALSRLPDATPGLAAFQSDLDRGPAAWLAWSQEAARPFFANHFPSWRTRMRRNGPIEVLRFIKACCSRYYLLMTLGRMSSLSRGLRGPGLGQRADTFAAPV